MARDQPTERYKAFISYSQKDSAEAGKIQSWLESFRLPKAVAAPGKDDRKLGRIFRDKTDLTASPEVWPALQAKIAASEYLIVLCSPNAAQSDWVDKEIRHFRETGRADKVLALIIAGMPNSGDAATECFPPAFLEREPLAANLVQDGRASALTRIAAGLASVPFDALWQREGRRQRRQMAFGGGLVALGLMLTAAALVAGWFALEFQEDARTQSALADERLATAELRNSDIIARESKAIFADESADHTTSILMALQADPSASRYAFARARLEAAVSNNRFRQVFKGHQGPVNSVALTGDGRLVTGSNDNTARLWDLETGQEIRAFIGHESRVTSVALTGDGRLVTGSDDHTARLWDLETGEEIRVFNGYRRRNRQVNSVALTGDGRLVTGSADGKARLWDLETGEELRAFTGHERAVYSVAVTGDGRLITGSYDDTALLWDLETGEEIRAFTGHEYGVLSVALNGDGRLITGDGNGAARLWELETGKVIRTFTGHKGGVRSVALTGDGRLVTGSNDDTARLWDLETGQELRAFTGHKLMLNGGVTVAVTGDGRLVTGSGDSTARLWDLETSPENGGVVRAFTGHQGPVYSVALTGDGRLVTGSRDRTVRLWDLGTGTEIRAFIHTALRSRDRTNSTTRTIGDVNRIIEGAVTSVALTRDDRLVSGAWDNSARLWDLETGKELRAFTGHEGGVGSVALTGDGRLVTGSVDRTARLWDLETGKELRAFTGHEGGVRSVALTGDGRLVTGSDYGTARLWDLETGEELRAFTGHKRDVTSVAVTGNGRLVTGSLDETARLWNLETGQEIRTFAGHTSFVTSVALTGDGRLVTGSNDDTARLWDLETGEEIRVFNGYRRGVNRGVHSVALTRDGRIVTGSHENNTARLWQLPAITLQQDRREQVRMACEMLHDANAPLWFTRADLNTYPVLDGEPRVDPDDPNSDFVSPCRCFLPDDVFEHPANKCPYELPPGD